MTKDIEKNRDREMIAVVVEGLVGKEYEKPTKEDKEYFINSTKYLGDRSTITTRSNDSFRMKILQANRENTLGIMV